MNIQTARDINSNYRRDRVWKDQPAQSGLRAPERWQAQGRWKYRDVLISSLALRENLQYSVDLRLREAPNDAERRAIIEKVILELSQKEAANTRVMYCNGGEKRRTSLATQLLSNASVFYPDEPTTGWMLETLAKKTRRGGTFTDGFEGLCQQLDRIKLVKENSGGEKRRVTIAAQIPNRLQPPRRSFSGLRGGHIVPRIAPVFFIIIIAYNCFCLVSCGESLGILFDTLFSHTGFAVNMPSIIRQRYTCLESQKLPNGRCPQESGEEVLKLYRLNQKSWDQSSRTRYRDDRVQNSGLRGLEGETRKLAPNIQEEQTVARNVIDRVHQAFASSDFGI
ncbi:hypothetical protein EG328_010516 [Venturia inaequalis]|uniref:Uncharacterized protein n=1 Tax=Venturia inaequalis TaxID=5025 RepID=A0A8H3VSU7_VENIN|nr:hypothetical protein EG328_010516 [Venturia inaequalis]KAE9993148.1 hypothetical protein EG327_006327 [Venturia inaequalis]